MYFRYLDSIAPPDRSGQAEIFPMFNGTKIGHGSPLKGNFRVILIIYSSIPYNPMNVFKKIKKETKNILKNNSEDLGVVFPHFRGLDAGSERI